MPKITIQTNINNKIEAVWNAWTNPSDITKWCYASEDWEAPHAENDVRPGGKFKTTMAAKDGSMSFDFTGKYTQVVKHKLIAYKIDDGRNVEIQFIESPEGVQVIETFDPENLHPEDMQRQGWQAILDNFKKYVETN
ncbi:MAG: SRPBCC domain-containing protein [Deferribacteres bacterium]|nr:SRPBCC family protein [candidate division KSB1 bacterium]MCB9502287.1 SRPBCC domain-containing protein [Deferribacteres bacterium]